MNKKNTAWILRIVVALLFIISAIAKIAKGWIPDFPFIDFAPNFAISTFEVKQLYSLGFSESWAPYFSRTLIGIEFALGFLLLHNHYLKKITIPATISLLGIFIIHLSYEVITKGNTGNCGCFGELLPMSPVEAILKNIVAIGLLIWLWKILDPDPKSNVWILTTIILGCILALFMIAPIKANSAAISNSITNGNSVTDTTFIDSLKISTNKNSSIESIKKDSIITITKTKEEFKKDSGPKQGKSGFTTYFSDLDNGKKILCFFAPGCEHCQATARQLNELSKKHKNFPEVRILFMDEETEKIDAFFKIAGRKYPYQIIDVVTFWTQIGTGKNTPGVFYYWNGNLQKWYEGIEVNEFKKNEFEKIVNK